MFGTRLDKIDPAQLGTPFQGERPAGEWLRYDPVYDEIKLARSADAEYLPQGIWQRDFKRADWDTVADFTLESLEKRTKDLQFGAWLTEALLHLYGIRGLTVGLDVLRQLSEQVWDSLYPQYDEDDEYEPRLLVLEWLDRQLPDGIDNVSVTSPKTRLVEPFTLRDWRELERQERADSGKKSKNSSSTRRKQKNESDSEGPTRDDLNTSIRLTDPQHFETLLAEIGTANEAVAALSKVYDEACGPGSARFGKFDQALRQLRKYVSEAQREIEQAREAEAGADADADAGESGGDAAAAPATSPQRSSGKAATGGGAKAVGSVDLVREVGRITDRDHAYAILESLANRMTEIDPHSPAPYLARRASSFRHQTFADLVMHFVDDDRMRQHLFRLLGIGEDAMAAGAETPTAAGSE